MRSFRNPFRARTLEQQSQAGIDDFLNIFSPGVLDLLPDGVWDRLLVIRSAPGFGKTSLMNAFNAGVLRAVADRPGKYRDLEEYLRRRGALDPEPQVVGFRIPLSRDFKALLDLGAPDAVALRLFMRLLDARIASAYIEALLTFARATFPEDAGRVVLEPHLGTEDALARIGGAQGDEILAASRLTDREIRDLLDSLLPAAFEDAPGRARLYSLDVLGGARVLIDDALIAPRPLLMLDDGHELAESQRSALLELLRSRDVRHARWYAERYTALEPEEIVSGEDAAGRTSILLRLEQATREGAPDLPGRASRSRRFEHLLLDIADRRGEQPLRLYADDRRTVSQLVDVETPVVDDDATAVFRERALALVGSANRYRRWVEIAAMREADDGALAWRELEILLQRDSSRTQGELFDQILDDEDWEARSSTSLREAAALFLARESRGPYYYGPRTIARLGSSNIDQFVQLCGGLFEEMLALITLNHEPRLDAGRQHRLIVAASEQLWRSIPLHLEYGRDIQRLLYATARMAHRDTYRPTAPYAPGVTGTAMSMDDRDRLINPVRRERLGEGAAIVPVLAGAIANNLLDVDVDRPVKGGRWMVLYLNRLLLPRFDLPLGRGGFRERPLEILIDWTNPGAISDDDSEQLPLPLTLEELQL
jgi:hypothetical protein